jgi:hypothetical protein
MKTFFSFLSLIAINKSFINFAYSNQLIRLYSNKDIEPVKIYSNFYNQKQEIFQDSFNKAGIYRLVNLINGKSYVGRSINLYKRFLNYYSVNYLKQPSRNNSIIGNALLKYGYLHFKLEIIEYCETKDLVSREQFYINKIVPESKSNTLVLFFKRHLLEMFFEYFKRCRVLFRI